MIDNPAIRDQELKDELTLCNCDKVPCICDEEPDWAAEPEEII